MTFLLGLVLLCSRLLLSGLLMMSSSRLRCLVVCLIPCFVVVDFLLDEWEHGV